MKVKYKFVSIVVLEMPDDQPPEEFFDQCQEGFVTEEMITTNPVSAALLDADGNVLVVAEYT